MESGGGLPRRRDLRPAAVGLLSLAAAVVAHRLSGAALPALPLLALLALPTCGVAAASARLPFRARAVLAGAGQIALHQLFMLLAAGGPSALPVVGHDGHAHPSTSAAVHVASMPGGHSTLAATLLHALATVAVVLLAAHGDRLLRRLLTAVLPRPLTRPALPPRARAVVLAAVSRARGTDLALLLPLRGPPALLGH